HVLMRQPLYGRPLRSFGVTVPMWMGLFVLFRLEVPFFTKENAVNFAGLKRIVKERNGRLSGRAVQALKKSEEKAGRRLCPIREVPIDMTAAEAVREMGREKSFLPKYWNVTERTYRESLMPPLSLSWTVTERGGT